MFNFGRPPKNPGTKLYEVLEVSQTATPAEIKKAYKSLSMKYHPDRPTGDSEKFKEINRAKEVLLNPKQREIYDEYGEEGLNGQSDGPDMPEDLIDMIIPGMRRRQTPQGPRKSKNIGIKFSVTLEDMYTGGTMPFEYERNIKCKDCDAFGSTNPKDLVNCEACKGKGQQVRITQMGPMVTQQIMPCDVCNGKGKCVEKGKECKTCKGKVMIQEIYKTDVSIRAGMHNGDQICLKGKAHQHPECEETGDLFLILEEVPSESGLVRNDNDLVYEKKIDLVDALCGVEFYIKHLDNRYLKVSYADIISDNQHLKVEGEGMPILDDMSFGDLYIKFNVIFPLTLDNKRKGLLKKILQKSGGDILNEVEPDKEDDVEDRVMTPIDDKVYHDNHNQNPFRNEENVHFMGDDDGGGAECVQQ